MVLTAAVITCTTIPAQNLPPRVLWWHAVDAPSEKASLEMWAPFQCECAERDLRLRRVETTADRLRLGIPGENASFLLDRQGRIRGRNLQGAELIEAVARILAESP